jgi:DNA-binding transcriptional MocR family regulator
MVVSEGKFLYEEIQEFILSMVKTGNLKPGGKIPSLRQTAVKLKTSVTTVMKAYMELERKGFIESRPKSGYFLADTKLRRLPQPEPTSPSPIPNPVSKFDLVLQLYYTMGRASKISFAVAEPTAKLLPTDELAKMMRKTMAQTPNHSSYEAIGGLPELKNQIAYHMLTGGINMPADKMIITSGGSEGIYLALKILTKPGDSVIVESPCYFGYTNILHALGIYALELPTHPVTGIDKEALRRALMRDDVKAAIIQPNFNNPLGCSIPEEDRQEIVDMFHKAGAVIIEDDIYGDLPHEGERPSTLYQFNRESVIYVSSFSKTLSPGYRVAWLCSEKYLSPIFKYKALTTVDTVRPTQLALAEYLASGKYGRHLKKFRGTCASLTASFTNAISKYFPEGTRITRPKGGFILWIELPPTADTLAIYHRANHEGIGFAPGTVFSSQDKYNNCMRINCAVVWNDETEACLKRLGELCHKALKA